MRDIRFLYLMRGGGGGAPIPRQWINELRSGNGCLASSFDLMLQLDLTILLFDRRIWLS